MIKKLKKMTSRNKKPLPTLERGTRSKAVRDYLAANPKDSPHKVVTALKEQGVSVSLGLVSVIKYSKTKKAQGIGFASGLIEAKRMADNVGGIENARKLLDVLEQLR